MNESFLNMSVRPISIEQFAKSYVCDDECPPGTFKMQKMIRALDKNAVSGFPLGLFDRAQKSPEKQGYYMYEWQENNPFDERPIWVRKGLS